MYNCCTRDDRVTMYNCCTLGAARTTYIAIDPSREIVTMGLILLVSAVKTRKTPPSLSGRNSRRRGTSEERRKLPMKISFKRKRGGFSLRVRIGNLRLGVDFPSSVA
jgi:hypothetical protein